LAGAALAAATAASEQVGAIGLSPYRAQRFENERILLYFPAAADRFGASLAVGDFNGDGADDLATGIPNDVGSSGLEVPVNVEISAGCSAGVYCPRLAVTREQMAKFLLRSKEGPSFQPAPCSAQPFTDTGCSGGKFCPRDPVTRRQLAVLLQRATEGADETPIGCSGNPFADVERDDEFCPYIRYLADSGITQGCGGNRFCRHGLVTRGQMAPLLIEAFDLFVPEL
jgi:hypothetical protein